MKATVLNPAASGNGAIAALFQFAPSPRAMPEQLRSATMAYGQHATK
jgi:hypothetical protein